MSLKDKYEPVFNLMNELHSSDAKIEVDWGTLVIRAKVPDSHSRNLIMRKVDQVNLEKGHDIDIKLFVYSE